MKQTLLLITISVIYILFGMTVQASIIIKAVPGMSGGRINTHAISGDGKILAFSSASNITGQNSDGNFEIFIYKIETEELFQITNTVSGSRYGTNGSIRINFDGTRIAFKSTMLQDGSNQDVGGYDIFLANINYYNATPSVTIQRLTYTDERGSFDLSSNGEVIIFASDNNINNLNIDQTLQIFRIHLDPVPSINKITNYPQGLATSRYEVIVRSNHAGNYAVITSDYNLQDIQSVGELDSVKLLPGPRNIFKLQLEYSSSFHWRVTEVATGDDIKRFANYASHNIYYTSNLDGNFELYKATGEQETFTSGGDNNFGGANRHLSTSTVPDVVVFSSNRNLDNSVDNSDGNNEIFMGYIGTLDDGSDNQFIQITNTSTAHPNSYIQNVYPQISSSYPQVIVFNSDMDLGTPEESILYVAVVDEGPALSGSVVINNLVGFCANPGATIQLYGDNLYRTESVEVSGIAVSDFRVLHNRLIEIPVPAGVGNGNIKISYVGGEVTTPFYLSSFTPEGIEYTTGIESYPAVAGKNALVRVIEDVECTETTLSSSAIFKVTNARLEITKPDGSQSTIAGEMFDSVMGQISNQTWVSRSENKNINFYIPGTEIAMAGTYQFRAIVEDLSGEVYDQTTEKTLTATKDVTMVFQSYLRHPNVDEWRLMLQGFELYSRLYPIRAGIGGLEGAIGSDESDLNTGLRVAYVASPIDDNVVANGGAVLTGNSESCYGTMSDSIDSVITAINSSPHFEEVEFGFALVPDGEIPGINGAIGCPLLTCEEVSDPDSGGNFIDGDGNRSTIWGYAGGNDGVLLLCDEADGVFNHESGHLLGLTPSDSPNYYSGGHPSNSDITEDAFNLLTRKRINFPINIMATAYNRERNFVENLVDGEAYDYTRVFDNRRIDTPVTYLMPSHARALSSSRFKNFSNVDLKYVTYNWETNGKEGKRIWLSGRYTENEGLTITNALAFSGKGKVKTVRVNDDHIDYIIDIQYLDSNGKDLGRDKAALEPVLHNRFMNKQKNDLVYTLRMLRPMPKNTKAIVVTKGSNELARLESLSFIPQPTIPKVKFNKTKHKLNISWSLDKIVKLGKTNKISYRVDVSRDGGKTFQPLLAETNKTTVTYDSRDIPGGDKMVFRVTASDGFDFTNSISEPISLPNNKPYIAITSPLKGRVYKYGESISFASQAFDMEEGLLANKNIYQKKIHWYIGKKLIDKGRKLLLPKGLPAGLHEITVKVKDVHGEYSQDSLIIRVKPDLLKAILTEKLKESGLSNITLSLVIIVFALFMMFIYWGYIHRKISV